MENWKKIALVLAVFLITNSLFGQGCSQCKLIAEQGSELDEASFGSNINYGILYLMAMPYIIVFFLFRKKLFLFFKDTFQKSN
ncbi:MAG: hypothetical protein P8N52_08575 [Crocinitomicaceae bacterium]|nr:hypothetical protein [Crocinitomicaceae bacterium]MDG1776788.1 hypothetical protein [Crocinitomicaceae bacterium]